MAIRNPCDECGAPAAVDHRGAALCRPCFEHLRELEDPSWRVDHCQACEDREPAGPTHWSFCPRYDSYTIARRRELRR
jgi:hypothetical protein